MKFQMNIKLKEKVVHSLKSVLPISGIVLLLSFFIVPMNIGSMFLFIVCAIMLVIGMGFFELGAEMSMTPLGEGVGVEIGKRRRIISALLICFIVGAIITIAEPDLQVLATQVPAIPNRVLILTVAFGVGVLLAVAILRILLKWSLSNILIFLYTIVFAVSFFVPTDFLSVAFDSGGVTTGPVTVPFIIAMGVGLTSLRSDKDANNDSFGLVALCSVGPILAVLLLGIFYNPSGGAYQGVDIALIETTQDVIFEIANKIPIYAKEVLVSTLPVVAVFFLFQSFTKRYHKKQYIRMLVGFVYTYIGLVLFLSGVNIGFAPVGSLLGAEIAGLNYYWILVPIGIIMGYFIVKAEPAVQVLNHQVEEVTSGAIPASAMNRSLSLGVATSVGLAMLRVILGIPLYWIIIPGYLIALILSRIVPKIFVGIAFDSGGVASGPMTATFLLPFAMGACQALGGNIMSDAFGLIALVALTPLIAVEIMGLIYQIKLNKEKKEYMIDADDEILELEEFDDE